MIGFKTLRQLHEWPNVSPLLREIIEEAHEEVWPDNTILLITDIYRTLSENASYGAKTTIHVTPEGASHRAADARTTLISDATKEKVIDFVEKHWIYDPERPLLMAVFGAPHGSGPHLHFQVHLNTRRRS